MSHVKIQVLSKCCTAKENNVALGWMLEKLWLRITADVCHITRQACDSVDDFCNLAAASEFCASPSAAALQYDNIGLSIC